MGEKTTGEGKKQEGIVGIFSCLKAESIQELFEERAKQAAFALGVELLEQDVERLCGGRFLLSFWQREDLNNYRWSALIEGFSNKVGVSKSAVSRAFQRSSQKDLDEINQSSLKQYRFVAIVIDGVEVAGSTLIAAVGISDELEKIPLGLVEGDTENADVVRDLLSSVQERGFELRCNKLLCLLDGSKALKKAVCAVFGERAIIQRCWLHKLRNIQRYIPKRHHAELHVKMSRMMGVSSFQDAKNELQALQRWLSGISESAAASLDEAGEDLLTLHKLNITGELKKSLSSTNIMESLFSVVRRKCANVKNWKSKKTNQKMRWIASSILEHKNSRMRKLRGVHQKSKLISALGDALDYKQISA